MSKSKPARGRADPLPIPIGNAAEQLIDDGAHVPPLLVNPDARLVDIAAGAAAIVGQLRNILLALSDDEGDVLLANMHRSLYLQCEFACDLLTVVIYRAEAAK